jgi:hypothetical protein
MSLCDSSPGTLASARSGKCVRRAHFSVCLAKGAIIVFLSVVLIICVFNYPGIPSPSISPDNQRVHCMYSNFTFFFKSFWSTEIAFIICCKEKTVTQLISCDISFRLHHQPQFIQRTNHRWATHPVGQAPATATNLQYRAHRIQAIPIPRHLLVLLIRLAPPHTLP